MSDTSDLIVDSRAGILSLTLNRPDNANALSPHLVENMIDAFSSAASVRLCVIRGEGKHFCAGFDLSDIEDLSDGDLLWRFLRIEHLLQCIHHAPFPVMAMAHGQVIGAGADLFAASSRRIAAADARFRFPGWNFGLALGTRRLARLIGTDAARDILIDTKIVEAQEALDLGLATDLKQKTGWAGLITRMASRADVLTETAMQNMLALTTTESQNDDLAAIIKTAGYPGLKDRVIAYRLSVKNKQPTSQHVP